MESQACIDEKRDYGANSFKIPYQTRTPRYQGEVAKRYFYEDGSGEIGIISSVSDAFCGSCNRARLSARGELFTCLFASSGFDLRRFIRNSENDEYLVNILKELWSNRQDQYSA